MGESARRHTVPKKLRIHAQLVGRLPQRKGVSGFHVRARRARQNDVHVRLVQAEHLFPIRYRLAREDPFMSLVNLIPPSLPETSR